MKAARSREQGGGLLSSEMAGLGRKQVSVCVGLGRVFLPKASYLLCEESKLSTDHERLGGKVWKQPLFQAL